MIELTPGGNASIIGSNITVRVLSGVTADVSSFRLYSAGKVRHDADMVFYGQKENDDCSIVMISDGTNSAFNVNLSTLCHDVEKIAFTATTDNNTQVTSLRSLSIQVEVAGLPVLNCKVDLQGRAEAALILGELYRRNNEWKFRFVNQGFNGGLQPLAEHFGVEIDDSAPAPASTPAPVASVSLSKVSLTKQSPTVSLSKQVDFGLIKINLDWNQNSQKRGLFSRSSGIDLDLGAFVRESCGDQHVIQALGVNFGSFDSYPFVELQGDDRTGEVAGGEWLYINGKEWENLDEILIYAFIYEGAPNWESTNGVVTIHVPGQAPIETLLTEGSNRNGMCAIARLINVNGSIKIERINRFFSNHKDMDRAFGWGFKWTSGSK